MRTGLTPVSADTGHLTCRVSGTGETVTLGPFDRFVHSDPGTAATALQSALEEAGLPVRAIGDAVAPRTLFEAMHDANTVARGLGGTA